MRTYVCFPAVFVLLVLVLNAYASWTITEDWVVNYTTSQIYNCAYNPTTDHVLVTASQTVRIYNASDGTPTGGTLQLPTGSGFIYAIACAEDGTIFAYGLSQAFYRWDNESAAAETITVTGLMSAVWCLRAYGSGTDIRIYVAGEGYNEKIQLIATDRSTTWTAEDLIAAPAAYTGVFAVPPNFTTVYGLQPGASDYDPENPDPDQQQGWPRRFDYTGTEWVVNTSFIPEDPNPDNHRSYCVGGDYIPPEGEDSALVFIFYYNRGEFWGLNADTGAKVAGVEYKVPGFTSYYANAQVDTTNKKIYYACRRSASQGGLPIAEGVFGRLSYSSGPTPTPTPTPLPPLYTFDFDTGAEGWIFSGAIIPFDQPAQTSAGGHLGLSPAGSSFCFGFWDSPEILVQNGATYRAEFSLASSLSTGELVPTCRLRVNQRNFYGSTARYIISGGDGGGAPVTTPRTYDVLFTPLLSGDNGTVILSFDIANFGPFDDANAWIYLESVTIEGVSVSP